MESMYSNGTLKVGNGSYVHASVHILGKRQVFIGFNTCVSEGSWLNVNHREEGVLSIKIGNNCFIGRQNFFSSGKSIEIGDYTLSTVGCKFICSSHKIENPEVPYILSGTTNTDQIKIGVNSFLGANVTIVGNVNIGHGSVVGANSLVLHDIPPFSLVIGNPARVIKRYCYKRLIWIDISEFSIEDELAMPSEQLYLSQLKSKFLNVNMPWIAAGRNMGNL